MGHQQLYWSHPRKFGQGSRSWSVPGIGASMVLLGTWARGLERTDVEFRPRNDE
ncbi:unnamed protein product [Knipowitschia caucasica]